MNGDFRTEEKELSIDTIEGLAEFLGFINDVYRDFIVALQQRAGTEVMVSGDLLQVETAHSKAQELITHYMKVLDFGGEIFAEQIIELQELYDIIVVAYEKLTTPKVSPTIVSEFSTTSTNAGVDITLDRAQHLAVWADELVYEFGELEAARITTPELKLGKLLYEELKVTAALALQKMRDIEGLHATANPQEILLIAKQIDANLDDIEAKLKQLQKSLLRFFEADSFKEQTPDRKTKEERFLKDERANKLFEQQSIFASTIRTLLTEPTYRDILQKKYSSPAAFEAVLKREVYKMEAPSKLDSLLGVKHGSAFLFLKDMTLLEIDEFELRTNRELVRHDLRAKNIPYEIYMDWMQALPYMESLVPEASDTMTFLELFIRAEIEMIREELTAAEGNTQGVNKSY